MAVRALTLARTQFRALDENKFTISVPSEAKTLHEMGCLNSSNNQKFTRARARTPDPRRMNTPLISQGFAPLALTLSK
ncbi:hypothetical protein J6590_000494 [Homalodisca vitripennis]|nr:hypothetical protein J6590_000494 [Homalodisca vitripennis]